MSSVPVMNSASATHMKMGVLGCVVHSAHLTQEKRSDNIGQHATAEYNENCHGDDGLLFRPMGGGIGFKRQPLRACGQRKKFLESESKMSSAMDMALLRGTNTLGYPSQAFTLGLPTVLVNHLASESIKITNEMAAQARSCVDASWELCSIEGCTEKCDDVELAVAYVNKNQLRLSWMVAGESLNPFQGLNRATDDSILWPRHADSSEQISNTVFGISICKSRCRDDESTMCAVQGMYSTDVFKASKSKSLEDGGHIWHVGKIDTDCPAVALTWNPNWDNEFTLLDEKGEANIINLEKKQNFCINTPKFQGATGCKWIDCMYGPQSPRSIMALSEKSIVLYDSCSNAPPALCVSLPNTQEQFQSFGKEKFVSMASPAPFTNVSPWPIAVATSSALHILDMRRASYPLLSWRWNSGKPASQFLELHFNDNCTGGNRWLDKVFVENDSERLHGAVTITKTSHGRLLHPRDAAISSESEVATSSCHYIPICREESKEIGSRALLPHGVGWHGMNNPIILGIEESYDFSRGCVFLGCSNCSNERIWADALMIGCDIHGEAWFQSLTTSQHDDKGEQSTETVKDTFSNHKDFAIPEKVQIMKNDLRDISFEWCHDNLCERSDRKSLFLLETKSTTFQTTLSEEDCCWELTNFRWPSTQREHEHYHYKSSCSPVTGNRFNEAKFQHIKGVIFPRPVEFRETGKTSATGSSVVSTYLVERSYLDQDDATLTMGEHISANNAVASSKLREGNTNDQGPSLSLYDFFLKNGARSDQVGKNASVKDKLRREWYKELNRLRQSSNRSARQDAKDSIENTEDS